MPIAKINRHSPTNLFPLLCLFIAVSSITPQANEYMNSADQEQKFQRQIGPMKLQQNKINNQQKGQQTSFPQIKWDKLDMLNKITDGQALTGFQDTVTNAKQYTLKAGGSVKIAQQYFDPFFQNFFQNFQTIPNSLLNQQNSMYGYWPTVQPTTQQRTINSVVNSQIGSQSSTTGKPVSNNGVSSGSQIFRATNNTNINTLANNIMNKIFNFNAANGQNIQTVQAQNKTSNNLTPAFPNTIIRNTEVRGVGSVGQSNTFNQNSKVADGNANANKMQQNTTRSQSINNTNDSAIKARQMTNNQSANGSKTNTSELSTAQINQSKSVQNLTGLANNSKIETIKANGPNAISTNKTVNLTPTPNSSNVTQNAIKSKPMDNSTNISNTTNKQVLPQPTVQPNKQTTPSSTVAVTVNSIPNAAAIATPKSSASVLPVNLSSLPSSTVSTNATSAKTIQSMPLASTSTTGQASSTPASATAMSFTLPAPQVKQVVSRQFQGLGLFTTIPQRFVQGQLYRFRGVVLNPSLIQSSPKTRMNFVNVIFSSINGNSQFKCIQQVDKNLQFDISCKIGSPGRYMLTVFAGPYGRSSFKIRSVFSMPAYIQKKVQQPQSPQNVRLNIIGNNLFIIWDSLSCLTNVTIYQQPSNKKQYLLSNYHRKFRLPFKQFENFTFGLTYVEVSHAQCLDGTMSTISSNFNAQPAKNSFQALQHAFDQNVDQIVSITPEIPWKMNVGEKFKFKAVFEEDVKNQFYIVSPNKNITTLSLQKQKIPTNFIRAGTPIQLQIQFLNNGTNILEINSVSGMAIVNRPIYIGAGYPLIPDFKDITPLSFSPEEEVDLRKIYENSYEKTTAKLQLKEPSAGASLSDKRNYMLLLLNGLRKKYGVPQITLDDQLNTIAQAHSDDMARNNYFSHTNLIGEGPGQRARRFNFTSSIGENIAQANYLTEGHLGLERSAAHLQNSVNQIWQRVGIGISSTSNNQFVLSYQFSTRNYKKYPLTEAQQQKLKQDLILLIKQRNPNIEGENKQLSSDIDEWMHSGKNSQMFQYLMSKNGYRGPMVASSFIFTYSNKWLDSFKNSNLLSGFNGYKVVGAGLGAQGQNKDQIQGYVVFA